jgi:ubiquinone/menaquinone biosynthesis C-methylase UbiE
VKLNNYQERNDLLLDWILETTQPGCSVLDVGANDGTFCHGMHRIVQHAGQLVGVDPDKAMLERNQFISERYFSTLEDADIPEESFDVLYSFFVFEHVADEERFMEAAARVLKSGGQLFFITPNGHHYFSILASFFEQFGIQRRVLGFVRTKELIDSYHYPALYRLNRPADIERIGRKYGFYQFEYRYCERLIELSTYFPGPTKAFPWLWEKMVEARGKDNLLVNLMGRMIKT